MPARSQPTARPRDDDQPPGVNIGTVAGFLGLTFAISWTTALVLYLAGADRPWVSVVGLWSG